MNAGYITVKCPRCSSTMEIIHSGVKTEVFLCPVCLEGEIQYNAKQPLDETVTTSRHENRELDHYLTAVGNFVTN